MPSRRPARPLGKLNDESEYIAAIESSGAEAANLLSRLQSTKVKIESTMVELKNLRKERRRDLQALDRVRSLRARLIRQYRFLFETPRLVRSLEESYFSLPEEERAKVDARLVKMVYGQQDTGK